MRALNLLPLMLLAGCHSYLVPFDARPLPALLPVRTAGGGQLDLDLFGELVLRPPPGDIEAALGVGLDEDAGGVVVTNRLRPEAALQPDDRIVGVSPAIPELGEVIREDFQLTLDLIHAPEQRGEGVPPLDFEPTRYAVVHPAGARPRAEAAHPVTTVDDLRPYLIGLGWLHLDLFVERDGERLMVRVPLRDASERLQVRPVRPELTRWQGVDLVSLQDWSEDHLPVHAQEGDLLVVRVARDSLCGVAGLRPLDLVPADELPALMNGGQAVVRSADGEQKQLTVQLRPAPTDLWWPFLLSYQSDGSRMHIGVGPLDLLGHYSSHSDYYASIDDYVTTWRWSVFSSVQANGVFGRAGDVYLGGLIFAGGARFNYLNEWLEARSVGERRRRWSLPGDDEDEDGHDHEHDEGDDEGD
jgi:hypothetical protein